MFDVCLSHIQRPSAYILSASRTRLDRLQLVWSHLCPESMGASTNLKKMLNLLGYTSVHYPSYFFCTQVQVDDVFWQDTQSLENCQPAMAEAHHVLPSCSSKSRLQRLGGGTERWQAMAKLYRYIISCLLHRL